ncbi:MAG: hypothetical protein K2G89_06795 [Lachnospiraceae bacterium]|nr:hypothetical protein [Lachnospiraceae bacterium]
MRVENSYSNSYYSDVKVKGSLQTVEQSAEQQKKSSELIDGAVSVNISRLGYTYAGELPVDDSHEVYLARRQMRQGIGISTRINGEFVGILAENYKNMADSIKENYTGDEFDRQMGILDKAYKQASEDLAHEYTQQMRILSGDIVIMPSRLTDSDYYSTAAEAEAHRREFDAAWDARKQVISREKGEQIESDVLKYLEAAKASVLDKCFFDWQNMKSVKTDVLNCMDLQKMGAFFMDKTHQADVSGVSSFVSEIISAYTNS